MRRIIAAVIAVWFSSVAPPAVGAPLPPWTQNVRELLLPNGMKFLLYRRGEAPIFTGYVRFRAGGIEEEMGKTGLAHFLEHMAFKGTRTLGTTDFEKEKPILDEIEKVGEELGLEYRGTPSTEKIAALKERLKTLHQEEAKYLVTEEVAKTMQENGGDDYNATTSKDMTSYFVSLPSDKLKFWATMESERIFKPVFREFYEEKDVVLEERRMRVDNDPDGLLYEALLEKAFEKSPYRWPTIGHEKDLLGLTIKDLEAFFRRYYTPSRAVGTLVGNFDMEAAERILRETFGKIEAADTTEAPVPVEEPPQAGERPVLLSRPARPRLMIAYHKPTLPNEDDYLFDLLDQILGRGRSSRLYRSLVLDKKVASDVDTESSIPGSRLPNLFLIEATPIGVRTPEEVLRMIDVEIERIQREGVTPEELEKVKNRLTMDLLWKMKTNEGLASQLSYFQVVAGDWRYLAGYLDQINRFGTEDIKRLATQYLNRNNRTIAILKSP